MKEYPTNPPFRLDDYTKSYRISSESNLNHLLDTSEKTWIKLREGKPEADIDLELRLTHFWDGEKFIPHKWGSLEILPCSESYGILSLLLREAINVDKELRLPDDTVLMTEQFLFKANTFYTIPLNSFIHLRESDSYPHGIYILVLRFKFNPSQNPPCLQKIRFTDKDFI